VARKRLGRHVVPGDPDAGSANADERLINGSFYLSEDILWRRWLRTVVGLRGDYFGYDVDDHDESATGPKTSGTYQKSLLSPKASLIVSPRDPVDLYLNFGMGFHSNDARLAIRHGSAPEQASGRVLPRAFEGELGSRARLFDRLEVAAALWFIYLQSETVFEGDTGLFRPSDPTRRYGADLELRARLLSWLYADADLSLARARFVGGGTVPLAPRIAYTAGLTARHPRGWKGALRLRGVGERPIVDPGDQARFGEAGLAVPQARGYALLDAFAGYGTRRWEIVASLENLLDSEWREAQFANRSCSAGQNHTPASPCSQRSATGQLLVPDAVLPDVHFTPGDPITLTLTAKLFF
jgi:outer membrane receptor protein involved in Fe transport